eukprot:2882228-Prymnesium_polylepis.1
MSLCTQRDSTRALWGLEQWQGHHARCSRIREDLRSLSAAARCSEDAADPTLLARWAGADNRDAGA